MCFGGKNKTRVVEREPDTTVDTAQPEFGSASERTRKLYLSESKKPTIEGDLSAGGQSGGATLIGGTA